MTSQRRLIGPAVLVAIALSMPAGLPLASEPQLFISEQQLTTEPKHVRLAYRPERPTSLLDVPGTFWTVQLVAVSTKEALEAYARAHQLQGMSAARIAHNGELYYALLLGVYETREIASQATTDLPAPLDDLGVWIRSLGSLQQAIVEGNVLAGGADF
ncbi:MAG: SPOR domain-containing protein [Gammaproteobacteria bacterium]|nr:SPOR domain-containing protein [Gammaproteobacteria bacterium]